MGSYLHRLTINGKRYLPLIRVSIHTPYDCYQIYGTKRDFNEKLDPSYQLLSVVTNKSLDSPAGYFVINLVGDEWIYKVTSNDLVVISMGYQGQDVLDTVMVGLVDRVKRTRTMNNEGIPDVNTTISGRDMGKMLIKPMLKFYPQLNSEVGTIAQEGYFALLETFFSSKNVSSSTGTPADLIDSIMCRIFTKMANITWTVWDETLQSPVPKKINPQQIIRYVLAKFNFLIPSILTLQSYEGSLWNLLEKLCMKPFMELFIDTRDNIESWNDISSPMIVNETIGQSSGPEKALNDPTSNNYYPSPAQTFGDDNSKVVLALRTTPFDPYMWNRLKKHELLAEDIITEELETSDDQNFNLFWAGDMLSGIVTDLKMLIAPVYNSENMDRYGLSPLEVTLQGLDFSLSNASSDAQNLQTMVGSLSSTLKSWYQNNNKYWSGTIECRGKGSYKVGQVLSCPGIEHEFYIEAVHQNFQLYQGWSTTLSVTRGKTPTTLPVVTITASDVTIEPATPSPSEYYTVKKGDTLWGLSTQWYGNGNLYNTIIENNPHITNANVIQVGMILKK